MFSVSYFWSRVLVQQILNENLKFTEPFLNLNIFFAYVYRGVDLRKKTNPLIFKQLSFIDINEHYKFMTVYLRWSIHLPKVNINVNMVYKYKVLVPFLSIPSSIKEPIVFICENNTKTNTLYFFVVWAS